MTTNSKQWQENSDGWVKATEESRKKKKKSFIATMAILNGAIIV